MFLYARYGWQLRSSDNEQNWLWTAARFPWSSGCDFVNARTSPLGVYLFADDRSATKHILASTASGAAIVNDCTVQPIVHDLPFGGVGSSGMGKYHGEWGFRAYTNARPVLSHSTRIDLGVRYPPNDRNRVLRSIVVPS